jgi:lysophospholipase L1-like esterase
LKKLIVYCLFFLVFHCQTITSKATINLVKDEVKEFIIRGGLPNFNRKVSKGDQIKVAYLGGSITAQNGWRVLSLDWFNQRFPNARFSEINAAIGGTGSDFGVFRLNDHVLKFKPDLVFVEFAVNDGNTPAEKIIRSMEGIVRQVWKHNPKSDICFVYTITEQELRAEQKGQLPASVAAMEQVADRYHIPTINFGFEVCKLVNNNQLIIKGVGPVINGIKVFSSDGVHPYAETGHLIYFNILKRSFETMIPVNRSKSKKHTLPEPLTADCFANTKMIDIDQKMLSNNWQIIQTTGQSTMQAFGNYAKTFGKASQSGETLTIRFKGSTIGAFDIMGPDAGKVIVEIDGLIRDTISRFDAFCTYHRTNYFLIDHLENKEHLVVFRVLSETFDKALILKKNGNVIGNPEDYSQNIWYVGKLLLDGILISPIVN